MSDPADFENDSMMELFRVDAEGQIKTLTEGLLALERNPTDAGQLEAVMRAAHSLKGAGRIVGIAPVVRVAHALEDCFVAAQKRTFQITQKHTDSFFIGVDLLARLAQTPENEIPATVANTSIVEPPDKTPAPHQDSEAKPSPGT